MESVPIKRENFNKKFYRLNIPIFISQAFLVIIGILNSLTFGQLGEKVLASVAIVDKLNGVYWPILTAISTVITVFLIQNNENNNKREVKKIFIFSNIIMSLISLFSLIIITIFNKKLISIYTKDEMVLDGAIFYIWAIVIANLFATITYSIITYFNGMGKVKESSIIGMFQVFLNFILYYIFIIKTKNEFFLGVKGISYAIIITKMVELIIYLKIYKTKFSLKEIKVTFKEGLNKRMSKQIFVYLIPLVLNNGAIINCWTQMFRLV